MPHNSDRRPSAPAGCFRRHKHRAQPAFGSFGQCQDRRRLPERRSQPATGLARQHPERSATAEVLTPRRRSFAGSPDGPVPAKAGRFRHWRAQRAMWRAKPQNVTVLGLVLRSRGNSERATQYLGALGGRSRTDLLVFFCDCPGSPRSGRIPAGTVFGAIKRTLPALNSLHSSLWHFDLSFSFWVRCTLRKPGPAAAILPVAGTTRPDNLAETAAATSILRKLDTNTRSCDRQSAIMFTPQQPLRGRMRRVRKWRVFGSQCAARRDLPGERSAAPRRRAATAGRAGLRGLGRSGAEPDVVDAFADRGISSPGRPPG